MESTQIYRTHYRGFLREDADKAAWNAALETARNAIQSLMEENKVMTAGLYYHGAMLFLYYETIGCELEPEVLVGNLEPFMQRWPDENGGHPWAYMYHIYYHNKPGDAVGWRRAKEPDKRIGRIAFLKPDKYYSYIYHHIAIVDEGLLCGDRYQSIALHENVLFSYFEEPKTMVNIQNDPSRESEAIKDWLALDPPSHFVRLPEANGMDFLILPAYFAVG